MRRSAPTRAYLLLPAVLLWAGTAVGGPTPEPSLPLEEIVRHFAQKEKEYAAAHALYRYQLSIKVQELNEDDSIVGEFEQTLEVDFDPSGRRRGRLVGNPRIDLVHLGIKRVELEDLEFVPLFVVSPEEVQDYNITYVTREQVDEVPAFLFRLEPREVVRPPDRRFEGIVWVDAQKLDVVRALGRTLPLRSGAPFDDYFKRLEIYREPVDDYLFPTYIRADDVLSVRGRTVRARLILRFSDHQRVREPAR